MTRALVLLCLAASTAYASSRGEQSFNSLLLDKGARPAGLAGAYGALASDVFALHYNPAGLARLRHAELSLMDNRYVAGVAQQYIGYVTRAGWGASLDHVSYGDISRTTVSQPDGTLGQFGVRDLVLTGGYGWSFYDDLGVGFTLRAMQTTLDDVSANGFAGDVGLLYDVPGIAGFRTAVVLSHIGPKAGFESVQEDLPTLLRIGNAYSFAAGQWRNSVAFDATKQRQQAVDVHFGLETLFAGRMALRLGYTAGRKTGFGVHVGIGWVLGKYVLDYAFVPAGGLGASHRLSAGFSWGGDAPPVPGKEALPGVTAMKVPAPRPPRPPNEHLRRAIALMEAGQYARAESELNQAAGTDARDQIEIAVRLGRIALERGSHLVARRRYRKAIQLGLALAIRDTYVAEAYAGIGFCLLRQEEREEAFKFFRKAIEIGPTAQTRASIRRELPSP